MKGDTDDTWLCGILEMGPENDGRRRRRWKLRKVEMTTSECVVKIPERLHRVIRFLKLGKCGHMGRLVQCRRCKCMYSSRFPRLRTPNAERAT